MGFVGNLVVFPAVK